MPAKAHHDRCAISSCASLSWHLELCRCAVFSNQAVFSLVWRRHLEQLSSVLEPDEVARGIEQGAHCTVPARGMCDGSWHRWRAWWCAQYAAAGDSAAASAAKCDTG